MATLRTCECGGWMGHLYGSNQITYICVKCGTSIKGDDSDRNRTIGGQVDVKKIRHLMLMKFAEVDPANPKIKVDCPKCKHHLAVYVEEEQTKKIWTKCCKCGNEDY